MHKKHTKSMQANKNKKDSIFMRIKNISEEESRLFEILCFLRFLPFLCILCFLCFLCFLRFL